MKKLNNFLNNLSIKKKLRIMSIFGALIPVFILFAFLMVQLSMEYERDLAHLMNGSMDRIGIQLKQTFITIENLSYTYVTDQGFNKIIDDYEGSIQYDINEARSQVLSKLDSTLLTYSIVDSITIFHNNLNLGNDSRLALYDDNDFDDEFKEFVNGNTSLLIRSENTNIVFYRKLDAVNGCNYLQIEVNKEVLKKALEDNFLLDNRGNIYIVGTSSEILMTTDTSDNLVTFQDVNIKDSEEILERQFTYSNSELNWKILMTIDKSNIYAIQLKRFIEIFLFGLCVLLISLFFSFWITKSINQRLLKLNIAMEKTENNDFTIIELENSNDEIGRTINRYNEMVHSISKLVKELENSKNNTLDILSDKVDAYNKLEAAYEEVEEVNEALASLNQELSTSYEEIKVQDEKINELIYNDSLTGLKNRYAITQTIDNAISNNLLKLPMAVLFIDIDNFKLINDIHGHNIGDMVISDTGNRLKVFESKRVNIGRFGGDEFLLLINHFDSEKELDTLLLDINKSFENPIIIGENKFYLTISIGVALYPIHGNIREDLVKKADQALYESKETGKNKFVIFNNSMFENIEKKTKLQNHIKKGFENNEFYLEYQPYFNAKSKELNGFEALIRWNSPFIGRVSPYDLIVNAEELGLIVEIGKWIFKEACVFAKKINQNIEKPISISINVSSVQLMENGFISTVMNIVDEVDISPSLICLEMTETILINSLEYGMNIVKELRERGFGIALDDFGTGYSSLKYFKELPVTVLKIDKAFIDNIKDSSYDSDLVKVMVTIAHNRDIKVTAEGVETDEQYNMLLKHNCDVIQGYLFSKPLEEDKAYDLVMNDTFA